MSECYKCGQDGHYRRDCPKDARPSRRRLWPKGQPPSEQEKLPAYQRLDLTRRPEEEIADYPARAAEARALLADCTGEPEPGDWVYSEFRRQFGLPPRPEAVLREIARQQVEESRASRHVAQLGE